jgi:rhodanese-related sulfurtransferase
VQEGALVAVIGAALAFVANGLSPRGLELATDYFPGTKLTSPPPVTATNLTAGATAPTNSPLERLAARLRENGLQLADSNQVAQLFRDPRREQDGVIFIDARDDEHYRTGHIPGAYQFDRFQPQNYLTNVVEVCVTAQQIVFYCNGGDCDDSEHAAIMLRDSIGIPREKVFVYGGGINEWTTNGLPVELGVRNSGQFTNLTGTATSGKAEGLKQ